MIRACHFTALALAALLCPRVSFAADPTAPVIREETARIEANRTAQQQVDRIHQKTSDLLIEYQNKLKIVDGLEVYTAILGRQLQAQAEEIETLKASIGNAAVIERQIVPLLMRMLDGLEEFIALDMPFLLSERKHRVARLLALMERADLTVAEKARRVFEAYQIENDYGRTLEAYKGKLDIGGRSHDVEYLRIGRIALLYRTIGNDRFGHWDVDHRRWVETGESQFSRNLDKGLRIARQETAPDMFTVPVPPPGEMPR